MVSLTACLLLCFCLGFSNCGVLAPGGNADNSLFNMRSGFMLQGAGHEGVGKAKRLVQVL